MVEEKAHSLEDLKNYRESVYYLCLWLAQVQRFAQKLEKKEPFDNLEVKKTGKEEPKQTKEVK